ncbi:MAG: preprotein translocase subunit SecY [Gammaproteobacteria bacterium AqS3]|nr:preprotein translocase subunit SecY [Gammaproteobacteria bacterium AqS3]
MVQGAASERTGLSELFARLRFLLIAIIIYRIGTHIPVPGIHPGRLAELFSQTEGTLVQLFNVFSGGALERMSIFALNIIPYISASIVMQMFAVVNPHLSQLRKEGEQGRKKISQYTRYLTVVFALIQSASLVFGLSAQGLAINPGLGFYVVATTALVTGTVFLMWLGEQITERGLGNGISMLIFASIVAAFPSAVGQALESARQGDLSLLLLLGVMFLAVVVMGVVVFIERGQRRIPVNYTQRAQAQAQGNTSYLPLKINMSGVIPAIFASSLLLFPATISQWAGSDGSNAWLQEFALLISPGQPLYVILFAVLIAGFCFFYTALMYDPGEVADNLKRSGGFVPGIRPGSHTAAHIDTVLTRLTLFGALYMVIICLLPQALAEGAGMPFYFGGTSVLIVVVVVMDFMNHVQAHLVSHQYGALMKNANLAGYRR